MSDFVGPANGLQEEELAELNPRLEDLDQQLKAWRASGDIGFFDLPYDQETPKEIKKLARQFKEWCRDVLVLGIGASASGVRALHRPFVILRIIFSLSAEGNIIVVFLWPTTLILTAFMDFLDDLELKRLLVNVISKSGAAP